MRKNITEETKERLISMYYQVEGDFEEFPDIKTTEDFFIWRDNIKKEIQKELKGTGRECDYNYIKQLRNERLEASIENNNSLRFLYAWSKCDRMVVKTKSLVRNINDLYGIEDNNHVIKATTILHNYLIENGKGNTSDLFDLFQVSELNLGVKYQRPELRTIHTPYELERLIFKQDEEAPWPAPLFVAALRAYGIDEDDLLIVGRKVIEEGKHYIEKINNEYSINGESKKFIYTNKGDNK